MSKKLEKFLNLENVSSIRQTGMVCVVELAGYRAEDRIGLNVYQYGLTKGVLLRPLGHIIYFMPPYIIKEDEIDKMMDVAYDAIKNLIK